MSTPASSIPAAIRDRISAPAQPRVWTPEDFADLGPRTAVDQALHRLVASRNLRRIARGFYDTPQDNRLTGKPTYPNPRDVIDALARKGKVRVVVDGLTAANDLGLTDAVPARIGVLTDGRLRPITRAGQRSDRVGSARQLPAFRSISHLGKGQAQTVRPARQGWEQLPPSLRAASP